MEEDSDDQLFTSRDLLSQGYNQRNRKIFFGKKCLFVLLGLLGLTTVVVLLTVFLVKSDLVLKLIGSNNDNDNIANFLPQCPSIDTSQLWTSSNTGRKALVVSLGRDVSDPDSDPRKMEIVGGTSNCKEPPVFPKLRTGMIAADTGEKVIICGGSESNQMLVPEKDCWHLETLDKHPLNGSHFQQKWDNKDFLELLEGRVGASAALTDKGWWVTGGLVNSSGSATSTTELFKSSSGTFVRGPDLPFALHKHCLVHIAAGLTLVIGGTAPTTPPSTLGTSLLYNWTSDSWCRMGALQSPRAGHSCALLSDSAQVLVLGGAQGSAGELLSLSDQTWRPGPEVPENITLSSSHLKILPDQKALLAGVGNMSSQVFSYNISDDSWKEESPLSQGRRDALFFSVHEKHLLC